MTSTKEWAIALGICGEELAPTIPNNTESCARSAEQIAARAILLHCMTAVGCGAEPAPICDWLRQESLWEAATPAERAFLGAAVRTQDELQEAIWLQEAEWALLWCIGKVESLGLPTRFCDSARLNDEIMPALGDSIAPFMQAAQLRSPGELLAEDDRCYNLLCYVRQAQRQKALLPRDMLYGVLWQRCYAFVWLNGFYEWDDVQVDS